MHRSKLYFWIFILCTPSLAAGCSTHFVPITYEAPSHINAADAEATVSMGNTVDTRERESTWLGAIRGGYGNVLKAIHTEEDGAVVVERAFESALMARGLLDSDGSSPYRLDITLLKFDTSYFFNKEAHAHFTMNLVTKNSGNITFSKNYRLDESKSGSGAGIFGNVEALVEFANSTLNQTIDKALDDPEFLAALSREPASSRRPTQERFLELEELKRQGLISDEEYQQRRKEILNSI